MPSSRPYCGYRRLSNDRDGDKLGTEVQTKSIVKCTEADGEVIGRWFDDPNVTAADEAVWREEYEQMLVDLAAGLYAGVVVYRVDRLTRLSSEWHRCIRAARKGRAVIISADERHRSDNEDQRFLMEFNVMMAEKEIRNMKIRIKANSGLRREKGTYQGGRRPYGFEGAKRDQKKKLLNPGRPGIAHIPEEVENLREAAERIVAGESYADIVRDWHSRSPPIYGASGAPWSPTTLEKVLTNPRMVGQQIFSVVDEETGVKTYDTADATWEPVLERATWELLKVGKKRTKPRGPNNKYLLTEVLLCGICKRPLKGAQRKIKATGGVRVAKPGYACSSGLEAKQRGSCGRLGVLAGPVDKLVIARIFRRLIQTREFGATMSSEVGLHEQIKQVGAELDLCEGELLELEEAYKDKANRMSLREYLSLKKPVHERHDQAKGLIKSLTQRMAVPHPVGRDYDDLHGWFEALALTQQRKLVGAHIARATVLPSGRCGPRFDQRRVVVTFADAHQVDG
jgi:DNA invertase Pin-like site-specific DNA recombinase